MAKKWEMPKRSTLVSWINQCKDNRNYKKLTKWEKEFIHFLSQQLRDITFIPSRETVEKLEQIYAERT